MFDITTHVLTAIVILHAAESYTQLSWPPQGSFDRQNSDGHAESKQVVPTLSYNYHPHKSRFRHQTSNHWRERQNNPFETLPIVEVDNLPRMQQSMDAIHSSERKSKIPTTGVYRTYGRGRAVVPYKGATIHVPKTFGPSKAYRGMISTRVFDQVRKTDNEVVSRWRRDCASCPKDEVVLASRGNAHVLLPEPCSSRWHPLSGPKPGSKLAEGIHFITGTIGQSTKVCHYKFEVKVLHCPEIKNEMLNVSCTADNAWGSRCNFTCPPKMKVRGSASSECVDNLSWSEQEPDCINNYDCEMPNIEDGTKLNCQTNELTNLDKDYFSEGSFCRVKNDGKESAIKCKKGGWVNVSHERQKKHRNRNKSLRKKGKHKFENRDACERNPCLNGGTCLLSTKDTSSYICKCPPSTEGANCEFTQCHENECHNGGRCLKLNGEINCFCDQNYTGENCEIMLKKSV